MNIIGFNRKNVDSPFPIPEVKLFYPRCDGNADTIRIGLSDVRAADDILVTYDFERDGWVIKQGSRFEWGADEVVDEDWQEVAFIQAWGRECDPK